MLRRLVGGSVGPHYVTPRGLQRLRILFPSDARAACSGGFLRERTRRSARRGCCYFLRRRPAQNLRTCRDMQLDSPPFSTIDTWISLCSSVHMLATAGELHDRLQRLTETIDGACPRDVPQRAQVLIRSAIKTGRDASMAYQLATACNSVEQFIEHLSVAARKMRRCVAGLVLLVELDFVAIESTREVIIEARALAAILIASRNTAKRRLHHRQARGGTRRRRASAG